MREGTPKPIEDRKFTTAGPGIVLRGRCWDCDAMGTTGCKRKRRGLLQPVWVCYACDSTVKARKP